MRPSKHLLASLCAVLGTVLPLLAAAQDPPAPPPPAPAAPPPPYSLPWQLRPAGVATVVRSDTAIALYSPDGVDSGGSTIATTLLGSYKVTPEIAPMVRLGFVSASPPEIAGVQADSGSGFLNPIVGGTYQFALSPNLKLAAFLGLSVPIGSGGGNDPDAASRAAMLAGIPARSAMDNAMFAMNYFTIFPGVDFAFVKGGFTAQAEVTFLELLRVRGDEVDQDASRTNMTMGLHVGYFIIAMLSVGADLRYQRWLVNDTLTSLPDDDPKTAGIDTATFAVGARLHLKLSETMWLRPGLAYARGIDDPMAAANTNIVQIDLPLSF